MTCTEALAHDGVSLVQSDVGGSLNSTSYIVIFANGPSCWYPLVSYPFANMQDRSANRPFLSTFLLFSSCSHKLALQLQLQLNHIGCGYAEMSEVNYIQKSLIPRFHNVDFSMRLQRL